MKKRFLALMLVFGMTFGLAGCAGSGNEDASEKKAEEGTTEDKETEDEAAEGETGKPEQSVVKYKWEPVFYCADRE